MSVKTNQYASPTSQDTSRGPSQSVWADCPLEDLYQGGGGGIGTVGYLFEDDFTYFPNKQSTNVENNMGKWSVFLGNNAGCAIGSTADTTNLPLEGGVIGMTAGANNALSVVAVSGCPAFRIISPATGFAYGGKLWFETRVAVGSVTSALMGMYVGLIDFGGASPVSAAADRVIATTNTLATAPGTIGFWKPATAVTNGPPVNDFGFVYNVAAGTVQMPGGTLSGAQNLQKLSTNGGVGAALSALAVTSFAPTAGFIKLGFVFDPTGAVPQAQATAAVTSNQAAGSFYRPVIRVYVNGQLFGAFLNSSDVQAATFPSGWMQPVIAFRSGGSAGATSIGYCDWIRVAQLGTY